MSKQLFCLAGLPGPGGFCVISCVTGALELAFLGKIREDDHKTVGIGLEQKNIVFTKG